MVNLPSPLVEDPLLLPLTRTVTPGSGCPLASLTVPLTVSSATGAVFATSFRVVENAL
ncbi:hypothetical protein D3C78_1786090 [compost metagenome]